MPDCPTTVEHLSRLSESIPNPIMQEPLSNTARLERSERRGGREAFRLTLAYPVRGLESLYEPPVRAALEAACGSSVTLAVDCEVPAFPKTGSQPVPPGVLNLIAVASAKGGVGKSTVAANLALGLSALGARVGLLDADIYGPSQPAMFGIEPGVRPETDGKRIEPLTRYGIALMSIGFLVDVNQAMIWRGPMVTQALQQLLYQTHWPELDYLVIDLPPGTGDIQLTLAQRVPLSGALIVTTPQDIAVLDARRGIRLFEKVAVPVLGIVENMSLYHCPQCGHEAMVFGHGGGETLAQECGIRWLGKLPLVPGLCEQMDQGAPPVIASPESELARAFVTLAHRTAGSLASMARTRAPSPRIIIEEN